MHSARQDAAKILRGEDDRLIIIVGPCSIHDVDAAKDYCKNQARMCALCL